MTVHIKIRNNPFNKIARLEQIIRDNLARLGYE